MGRELVSDEAKRKKRVRGEERERWEKWLRAEVSVGGRKKDSGRPFSRSPAILPLREVGQRLSVVQGPNRLYRGEK
jgi:hypothetical protein